MRRALIAAIVASALAIAGCGSSSTGAGGVRGTEATYFPSDAPFVLSVQTDPNSSAVKNGQELLGRFPAVTLGEGALMTKIQQEGIDYQSDIRPLFGEPAMLGSNQSTLNQSTNGFLVVWVTRDAAKLSALIKKLNLHDIGTHDGATIYQTASGTSTAAVQGATLVVANGEAAVFAALDRHAHGGGMSFSSVSRYTGGLPSDAAVQIFGSLNGELSTPRAVNARRVPWVAALRGYGASVTSTPTGVTIQYRLDTSGTSLTPSQLPIAAGSSSAGFAGALPITFALNDPAQLVSFAEQASQSSSPSGYASFQARQASVRAKTGVDLNSVAKLLTGTLIIASDTHTTLARAGVSDPATASSDLAKLVTQPASVFSNATSVAHLAGGFYALKERKTTITIGVTGNQMVAGKASAAQLRAFASAPVAPSGLQGSMTFRIALDQLLRIALKRTPSKVVQTLLSSLGNITGSSAASTSALTGTATLALH